MSASVAAGRLKLLLLVLLYLVAIGSAAVDALAPRESAAQTRSDT